MLQIMLFDQPPHLLELSIARVEISLLHVFTANYALGYHLSGYVL